jgi:hypothetical protein
MSTMNHVRYLAETIGPRGSTTQKEKAAAQYASQVLEQAGLKPVIETFESGRSSYSPYALFSAIFLVGVFLFWIGGRWGAIVALLLSIFDPTRSVGCCRKGRVKMCGRESHPRKKSRNRLYC